MRLRNLLKGIKLKRGSYLPDVDVRSVSTDSRRIKRGSLFVAIDGFALDGHRFVKEAFRRGALASVVSKSIKHAGNSHLIQVCDTRKALSVIAKNFYHSPSEKLKIIGITGTKGKTTTSFLAESIFNRAHIPCGVIGTIDYRFGRERTCADRTTPDALTINEFLDKMLKHGMKAAVMEVSSHALDQKRVDDILLDAAIFTNLTREHLDYHGDMERYFASKLKIFSNLKKGGVAIFNADDRRLARLKRILKCRMITYGMNSPADISADIKKMSLEGTSLVINMHKKNAFSLDTKLLGLHNVSNILASVALGFSQSLAPCAIKEGIEKVSGIRGRLEAVKTGQGFKVFVDYAHTHNALENVLGFLKRFSRGSIITVFGCGGERDRGKRPLMGSVVQRFSDFFVITNDNPRNEDPEQIVRDVECGLNKRNQNYTVMLDRKKAIEKALKKAEDGDIVLLAGKGHETEQVIGQRRIAFNDKETAEEILKQLQLCT